MMKKNLPIPENVWQDTLHKHFIPPLHKGHTHVGLTVLCSQLHMQVLELTEL